MKLYTIHRRLHLPVSLNQAWEFFGDPMNLEKLTPSWLRFQIESALDRSMYPGMIISYQIKAMAGIPMRWITEITQVEHHRYFIDEQRFGPYRFWHHQHHFRRTDNGVEIEDLVHYALPAGIFGRMVHALSIKHRLQTIFDYRSNELARRFGSI